MRLANNLDFCIIYNPLFLTENYIVYFTKRGQIELDYNLRLEEGYQELVGFLKQLGFLEVDYLTFEFFENDESGLHQQMDPETLQTLLESVGATYSIKLENKIMDNLEKLKQSFNYNSIRDLLLTNSGQSDWGDFPTEKSFEAPKLYRIPEIGEKISLYFYLFLEAHFVNENECRLKLNGDFDSKENKSHRNFLRIINADFIRVESQHPNIIRLQCCKSGSELIKEVSFLQGGYFQYQRPSSEVQLTIFSKPKKFFYTVLEIRNKLRHDDRISVEVEEGRDFNLMMEMSKKLKSEFKIKEKEIIKYYDIEGSFKIIKDIVSRKMMEFAEEEEFKKAAQLKRDLSFLKKKEKLFLNKSKNGLTFREYNKFFCFS